MQKDAFQSLLDKIPQVGKVEFISVRPQRKATPVAKELVLADKDKGLEGDHFSGQFSKKRQVTLIQKEHLNAVAGMLHRDDLDPLLTRRNIVVSGINILALKDQKFQIGKATLQATGLCHPCSRMEENLGPGGYNAMRGHGGITAKVIVNGEIQIGDEVRLVAGNED